MVTLLFTSVFIIGLLAVALYFWAKPVKGSDRALPPRQQPRGLFSEPDAIVTAWPNLSADETAKQRSLLLAKARSGNHDALEGAQALRDKEFYDRVLDLLVAATDAEASLPSLVSHVERNELPVNNDLAQAVLDSWQKTPDRNSTARALHFAALADDAQLYQSAVEATLKYWQAGKLANVSPRELQALFDGEFWVLSSRTRGSGAGFILKRTLANARRELGNSTGIDQ